MDSIENERDIIIVTGCNAVGKTTASNYLRKLTNLRKILYENCIIADSLCLFEAMQLDDQEGGLHHTHDWCAKDIKGHIHDLDQPIFPFTVTDNELPNRMRIQFFTTLTNLQSGKLWFVEWAAGVNTNALKDSSSSIDYSYATVKKMLLEGSLPDGWLSRIKAIIHLEADYPVRFALNQKRCIPSSPQVEAIENGTAFWQKDERVLRFYGCDDFSRIKRLFRKAGIPIYTIKNDGGTRFFGRLGKVANALFPPNMPPVAKLLSDMATATKLSFIYLHVSHMLSLFIRTKSTKPAEESLISNKSSLLVEKENIQV